MLQSAPPPLSTHVVEQAGRGVPALALDAVMLGEEGGHLLGGHHQHLARHCDAQLVVAGHRAQQDFFAVNCLVQMELTQQPVAQLLGLQSWAAHSGGCVR
jgi:hypothetical protein